MKKDIILFLFAFTFYNAFSQPIIIDHNSVNIEEIPLSVIDDIQANIKYHYCHSSYGRAIRCGLTAIEVNPIYDVSISTIDPCTETSCLLPTTPNSLCVLDGQFANGCTCYITPYGYWLGAGGVNWTIETLNENPSLNVSHFTWCAEPEGYSAAQIDDYLSKMEWLEVQKPNVTFVYSTCTSQQSGDLGYNRHIRNDQIRDYCIAHNKILFDVEDIQAWYNGVQNYYVYNGQNIPLQHSAYNGSGCNAHMNDLCSLLHGKATWYMMARIRGWNPTTNQSPIISDQTFNINENTVNGTIVGTVIATDPDTGQTLTYSIISGNTNNAFDINSTTGDLTVNNSSALNYEVITAFGLTVKVHDNGQGNLYSQATVTVNLTNVNENPNVSNQTFSIAENSPNGHQVGIVIAIDPDAGQTLTYSIISGNTNDAFSINSATGALLVNNSSALNYEVISSFDLTIRAQDNGQGNLYSQATVSVNITDVNEQPQIENQTYFVSENTPNGQAVATVIAADPDNGQSLLFTITAGNSDNAFIINPTTGVITVNNSSALNILNNPNFYLTVIVQDNGQGNLTNQALITMTLTDVNQQPVISDQTFDVEENTPNGQVVGTVYATDPDFGQILTYSIINGNTNYAFAINFSTGDLSVNNSSGLNFEVTPTFNLIVEVQDNGAGNLWAQASITVNITDVNESPDINDQTFSIEEYSLNGTEVGTLVATDPDNGQTLTYSILSGNENNAFILNSTTRVLTVWNSSALDFETNPVFSLVVKVTDDGTGNLTDQATITVNLSDVNENPEINDQTFAIEEYSPNGTVVGTLIATDPDNSQTLIYSILSGNENNAFILNSATGILTVGNSSVLDFETTPVFSLVVKVTDDGTGNLTDEATITVNLTELVLEKEVIPKIVTCKLYPNPAINYIDLRLENISKDQIWISILNLSGETILHEEFNAESEILMKMFEIGGLSKGVYIIKIKSGSISFLEKFIKL